MTGIVIAAFAIVGIFIAAIWGSVLYNLIRDNGLVRSLLLFLLVAAGWGGFFYMVRYGGFRGGGFVVLVLAFVAAMVAWAIYNMFGPGSAVRVSPGGAERSCNAWLYAGRLRPSRLVKLVVTPDSITAYVRFRRKGVYQRGQQGLADATMYGFRAYASQIRDIRRTGFAYWVRITDLQGNRVYLFGRGVPEALSILRFGPAMPSGGFRY